MGKSTIAASLMGRERTIRPKAAFFCQENDRCGNIVLNWGGCQLGIQNVQIQGIAGHSHILRIPTSPSPHFSSTQDPIALVRSLAYQLGVELPEMGDDLTERLSPLDVLRLTSVRNGCGVWTCGGDLSRITSTASEVGYGLVGGLK